MMDYNKVYDIDWAFEISCRECDQRIIRNLYIRDFDTGRGVGVSIQRLLAEHIMKAHPDELEGSDDDDKDIPAD